MKKILYLFVVVSLLSSSLVWAGGGEEKQGASITILQNKIEIDAQLKDFAKVFQAESGIEVIVKSCGGDSCSMATQMRADFNAGEAPDIFVIDGLEGYNVWSEHIDDLSNESWVSLTDLAFKVDGKVVGFPVSIEGWGMGYNLNLLNQAGIDPATLTNYNAYKAAFEKLDSMKDELGIDSVVSMTAGPGMYWVTGHHNINSYLSNGLARDDLSVVNQLLEGKVDATRFREYAEWVKLLFDYSDKNILTTGDYDGQVNAFANQKAVFIHQGNWIEPNLANANATFPRAYAPHGSSTSDTDGVFVSPPAWYVVNKDRNAAAAKQFLKFMAESEQGHDYMVNKILAIPAFKNVKLQPKAPLSASLLEWASKGKTYAWNQYLLPGDYRDNILGPMYDYFAKGEMDIDEFIEVFNEAAARLKR